MQDQVNKWAPGPWEFAPVGEVDFRKPESEDFMIVDAEMCCVGILWGHAWKHGEPNAHLIRTAPELYEELERAVGLIDGDLTGAEWKEACHAFVRDARAVLAKARGAQ